MKKITVIGSINVDLVALSDKRPKAGETVMGNDLYTIAGGKGGNQAVAAARLNGNVVMLGCIGNDDYGEFSKRNLDKNGVEIKYLKVIENQSTGVAVINVAEGDNSIIVIPGSNAKCDIEYMNEHKELILESNLVILQLEIPLQTVEYVVKLCKQHDVPILLNPAPACKLSQELIDSVTYLTPNEHEFDLIFGTEEDKESILQKYPNKVLVTEGEKGVIFFDGTKIQRVPAYKVDPIDTTGAGDTFNGAFAVGILEGKSIDKSIEFANHAASISVTKLGAQGGMPYRDEISE